jgi:hypothetical protein
MRESLPFFGCIAVWFDKFGVRCNEVLWIVFTRAVK